MSEIPKILYRCSEYTTDPLTIHYQEFEVLRQTPRGVWILASYPKGEKWVSFSGMKRFAYPTQKEALASFKIRKVWQRRHCEMKLGIAIELLDMIEKGETTRKEEDCLCKLYQEL